MKRTRLLFAALFLLGTMAVGYYAAPVEASGNCRRCNLFKNTCPFVPTGWTDCTWDVNGECQIVGPQCSS
jgi:hypothetical protein